MQKEQNVLKSHLPPQAPLDCLLLILILQSKALPAQQASRDVLFMALIMESLGKILVSHSQKQKFIHRMFLKFITGYIFFPDHIL